jgi:hypothetical protein
MGAQCAQSPTSRCTLGWIEEAAEGVEGVTEENSTDDPEVVDLRDTPQEMSCSCSVLVETLPANHHYEALPRTRTEIPRVSEDPVLSRKRTEGRSSSVEVACRVKPQSQRANKVLIFRKNPRPRNDPLVRRFMFHTEQVAFHAEKNPLGCGSTPKNCREDL